MTEAEIIVVMREALEVLKEKWHEAEGGWALVDFMAAAHDEHHWMQKVVRAEQLSEPYMPVTVDNS